MLLEVSNMWKKLMKLFVNGVDTTATETKGIVLIHSAEQEIVLVQVLRNNNDHWR